MHFSYELEASLTDAERAANKKICAAREEIANNEFLNRTIHNYFENKATMESSKLFKMLNTMPKGAIHHIHTTAANPIDAYLKLTYDDRTYYSQREDLFKVYPLHSNVQDGYIQTTVLRSFAASAEEFDTKMKNVILLGPEEADDKDSHEIWKFFQHKFTKVGELGLKS